MNRVSDLISEQKLRNVVACSIIKSGLSRFPQCSGFEITRVELERAGSLSVNIYNEMITITRVEVKLLGLLGSGEGKAEVPVNHIFNMLWDL